MHRARQFAGVQRSASRLLGAWGLLIVLAGCARTPAAPVERLPVGTRATSKTIESNGVEFRSIADAAWKIPARDATSDVALELQITNRTAAPLRFNLFDTVRIALTSPEGVALLYDGGRNRAAGAVSEPIEPGKSLSIARHAQLKWVDGGDNLRLIGSDDFRGIWYFDGLKPGTYSLRFQYDSNRMAANDTDRVWIGVVETEPLEIQLLRKENG